MIKNGHSYRLTSIAAGLAFLVIMLGAYTRLTNAGLGCPDWPGCYGQLTVASHTLSSEQSIKAWTEMIHRYCAGTLGLIILVLLGIAIHQQRKQQHPLWTPILLTGLLIFQAMLGMWTVTLKLHPLVVMGHLLGGLTLLSLLWSLRLQLRSQPTINTTNNYRGWALLGLIILTAQIALGGWVSSNYAGVACIGFPFCNGQLWPSMNLSNAFHFTTPLGVNYQGGMLDSSARITIQMMHRLGALLTFIYLSGFSLILLRRKISKSLNKIAIGIFTLCLLQVTLGIINVTYLLPLSIAVLHNGVAALLLLTVVTLNYHLFHSKETGS